MSPLLSLVSRSIKAGRRHLPTKSKPRRLRLDTLEDRTVPAGVYPNDPGFSTQWMLHNTGQTGGAYDADIDAPEAWSVTTGSMATVVAVIDNGVDYTDPDLYLNVWLNPGEIPASLAGNLVDTDGDGLTTFRDLNAPANAGYVADLNANGHVDGGDLLQDTRWENGVDEDGNDKTDDLVGWDSHDNDNDPKPEISGGSHGTNAAKFIGALTDNNLGGAGLNWAVRLMAVRIRNTGTDMLDVNAAAGLDYAVASGAPISINSWRARDYNYSQVAYDAISRAGQAGHLFVAAAWNDFVDNDVTPFYPASYDLDNIISVTGTTALDQLAHTNYGAISVDLGASHDTSSGASQYTAGAAALLKSLHPEWDYTQLKAQLMATVDPLPSLAGKCVTGGRLNVARALDARFISVSDASAVEGDQAAHYRGAFVDGVPAGHFNPLTFGPDGRVYTAVGTGVGYNSIQRYDATTGDFIDTFVPSGRINGVRDIVFRDGYMYVASAYTDEVLRYDATSGAFVDVFVTANSGGIDHPDGMMFGPDANNDGVSELYVTGWLSHNVVRYDGVSGQPLGTFVTPGSGGLSFPFSLASGPGGLYVTSAGTNQILKYDAQTGAYLGVVASTGLDYPRGLTFGPDGLLYVTSGDNDRILRFTAAGTYVDDFVPAGAGGMDNPRTPRFGPDGDLYVTSTGNAEIMRFGTADEAVFIVSLSNTSPSPVSVDYTTANGTAVAGTDYVATSGTVTLTPGRLTRPIYIPTLDDTTGEPTETFSVNLSNPVGATIDDGQGVGSILDNETKFFVVDDAASNLTYEYGSGGASVESYPLNTGNTAPRGAASTAAGDKVWVVDANKKVYVYNTAGGLLGSWTLGSLHAQAQVEGIATNGTDVWIVDAKSDKVFKYTNAAGRLAGTQTGTGFNLTTGNTNPKGIVTNGTHLWVVNDAATDRVYRYTVGMAAAGNWAIDAANALPTGITLDPTNVGHLWIVDSGTDRVYQYDNAAGRTSGSQLAPISFGLAAGNTNPQDIADPPTADMLFEPMPVRTPTLVADERPIVPGVPAWSESLLDNVFGSPVANRLPEPTPADEPKSAEPTNATFWAARTSAANRPSAEGLTVPLADSSGNELLAIDEPDRG